jgi:hypothetical protein
VEVIPMSLLESYAIWNNKGGVGKSTIAFHLAIRYAEENPKRRVLVIDLCPQANASMMLLGGGTNGEERVLELCQRPTPPTVVGYLATALSQGEGGQAPDCKSFVITPSEQNENLPKNIRLLSGDGNLEPMAPLISERATQAALLPTANPWKWVHLLVTGLVNAVTTGDTEWIVLVDTNPSFSIYTEIAISSVRRLIVPVNPDDASRVATNAMFTLIHGADPPHPIYGKYTYAARADTASIARPQVHLVVGNRLTQYEGPAKAYGAMSDATADTLFAAFKRNRQRFTTRQKKVTTLDEFRAEYSIPLRDFNTAGVVAAHLGTPLSRLRDGQYKVYGVNVPLNSQRIRECRDAIDNVVKLL